MLRPTTLSFASLLLMAACAQRPTYKSADLIAMTDDPIAATTYLHEQVFKVVGVVVDKQVVNAPSIEMESGGFGTARAFAVSNPVPLLILDSTRRVHCVFPTEQMQDLAGIALGAQVQLNCRLSQLIGPPQQQIILLACVI